ncbi:YveK family protein [Lysinibacillus odysseyi]|uniref:Capsular biosynthesis protein n=1 Tax=Lysinibacillus odysseyi 34hs-1 = NBRC 100172 TaxID=1220589 RepID=A0A0A3IUC4_9BACI|nr:Wzz/FepE/Etk N-terminal domain-containing protein [Lysinibacillus odysseyi]KGR86513.1 hypothetical protein CD32_06375 [Lysinibacillus odysseyi 34hs-1 = NBRC 100172]
MSETISLQELVKLIKKKMLLIIGFAICSAGITAYLSFYLISPVYEAQTQLLVNQKNISEENIWAQMETDLQLISTYNVIIKSPVILNKVIEKLSLQISEEELMNQITVSNESDSKVVNISVRADELQQAVNIANTIAEVFQTEIPNLMSVNNINILSAAKIDQSPNPVEPNITLNIAAAFIIGAMAGIGVAFLREVFDVTIKTEKDIENILQLPVLGMVSSIPFEKEKKSFHKT